MQKAMKNHRRLPIPFLVVILAGVLSVFTSLANDGSAGNRVDNSVQMQSIEQERMAAMYFRVMTWLSSAKSQAVDSAKANSHPAPTPRVITPVRNASLRPKIRFCSFHTAIMRNRATLN